MSSNSQANAEMQDEQKGSSDSESDIEIDKHQADEVAVHKINGRSIKEFSENALATVMEATKCANAFPAGTSRNLYAAYPAFNNAIQRHSEKMLGIISKVLKLQQIKGNIQRRDNDEKLELMLECNDIVLERVNSNLDILAGIRVNPETILIESEIKSPIMEQKSLSGSWNENRKIITATRGRTAKLLTARNIIRPQINFKIPVDNRANVPFEPRLKYKPHSIKPLAILAEYDDDGNIEGYLHPYECELDKLEPSEIQLKSGKVIEAIDLEQTPLVYVDNDAKLKQLLDDLNQSNEIAVDLEHHSYRTFQGITCLLQISTRKKDYIVDTLALRDDLHILNEVFANPRVLKVFHGADCDIEWLQRDLSIYVVNMFDTHQAAKRLNLARLSLAFLLKHYCKIDADKSLQLADWRMRPLPDELITYARQDTHYLLYIYDMLRQELLKQANGQTNLLQNVYQLSKDVCKKRYVKVKILNDSYMELYHKSKRIFDNRQLYAFRELYAWRDKIARQDDESYGYVLPNHMMLQIAENLPREMQGILACCNPIPPLVRQNLHVLHQFILKAREQPLVKIVLEEQATNRTTAHSNQDLNSHLYCPHDLSSNTEFRDDLPTLLGRDLSGPADTQDLLVSNVIKKNPAISVFADSSKSEVNDEGKVVKSTKARQVKFVSPYARYLAVLPFAEQQRLEEIARKAEADRKKKLCPEKNFVFENDQVPLIKKEAVNQNIDLAQKIPFSDMLKRKRPTATVTSTNSSGSISLAFKESSDQNETESEHQCKKRRIEENTSDSDANSQSTDSTKATHLKHAQNGRNLNSNSNAKQNKQKNRKNKGNTNKVAQSSNQPVDYDYSKVDFSKFQGGSKKERPNTEFKSKFNGKGKNNKANKQFNKLFAFSNANKRK